MADGENKGLGRPPYFTDVEVLEKLCDSYFSQPEGPDKFKPSVTGLALWLGFADKTSLYEYRDKPDFSYPIKKSLTKIEQYHEEALDSNSVAGRIFALKNMGWRDKVETGFTDNEGKNVQPQIIFQPAPNCNDISNPAAE